MAKIQFPLQFERQYSSPIDIDMVFETTISLNNYLTNEKRYAGMIVTCKTEEGKIFVLNIDKDQWIIFDNSLYEKIDNKVTSFDTPFDSPTDVQYPSAKLVKEYVDSKVSSVYRVKGSVANYNALPTENLTGDVYNLLDTGDNYVWDGTAWDKLGASDGGIPDTLFIQDTPPTEINKYIWYSPSEEEDEGLEENQIQTKSIEGDDIIAKQIISDIIVNQSDDSEKILESNASNDDVIINYNEEIQY